MVGAFSTREDTGVPGKPVFAIFQGGGAAGIAHLGAAVAAEEEGLEFIGVAGASAGALVAALLAAGYRGKELFNPESRGSDLLSRYNSTPTDLLGESLWDQAKRFRVSIRSWARTGRELSGWKRWVWLARRIRSDLLPHINVLFRAYSGKGHFDTERVEDFVNWALREKLKDAYALAGRPEEEVPTRVTFADLNVSEFPRFRPLKIIATDIVSGQAVLFSQNSAYQTAEIGAAVAASISIPGVFRPVEISDLAHIFVDGGLVSNLPTWTFLEEKLAYEREFPLEDRVPIVAFSLDLSVAQKEQPFGSAGGLKKESVPDYINAVVRAGISGSQSVSQNLISDLVLVQLKSTLGVLDFDAGWSEIHDCYKRGLRDAQRAFARSLRLRPEALRSELETTVTDLRSLAEALAADLPNSTTIHRLRAAIIVPAGNMSLRVLITFGGDTEADDNLLLDRAGPASAAAFRERVFTIVQVTRDEFDRPTFSPDGLMTKYEAALLWRDVKTMICAPIFADPTDWTLPENARTADPLGVLSIDSDGDITWMFHVERLRDVIIRRTLALSQILAVGSW